MTDAPETRCKPPCSQRKNAFDARGTPNKTPVETRCHCDASSPEVSARVRRVPQKSEAGEPNVLTSVWLTKRSVNKAFSLDLETGRKQKLKTVKPESEDTGHWEEEPLSRSLSGNCHRSRISVSELYGIKDALKATDQAEEIVLQAAAKQKDPIHGK
ncbi:hypothetical protein NDU88_002245 [Pleurodeles waltl]|uniref:Uncharacterized protein n=1 Tax=Pleurodeles waltl TaxID=8319 RepID=A0AAV7UCL6_PLEWA|nr:hypothetical protein NDU88_002245 [Pleurodeles waltl]